MYRHFVYKRAVSICGLALDVKDRADETFAFPPIFRAQRPPCAAIDSMNTLPMPRPANGPPSDGASEPLVERLVAPFRRFASVASAGGVVLLAATAMALAWANSPWAESYHRVWQTRLAISLGGWRAEASLHHLISDGLMAVFFFLVGLEIKREILAGELKSARNAVLPIVAAFGGMIVPAALFAALNARGSGAPGWGIPMATDIAFSLGVLALLGDRVPASVKVFLAAFAIVDDIGAMLVISVFYSAGVVWLPLVAAACLLALAGAANVAGVRSAWAYGALGVALWSAMLLSGVHATVAGVLLAMTIPVRTRVNEQAFLTSAQRVLADFDAAAIVTAMDPDVTVLSNTDHHTALEELVRLAEQAQPPLIRLEHALHVIVSFVIVPIFALANAGVSLSGSAIRAAATSPLTLGVVLGLVVGKPLGIVAFSWLAVRLRLAALPNGTSWPLIAGVGVLGGVGFTMALFIAGLAFSDGVLLDGAKVGILAASTVAGVAGWLLIRGNTIPGSTRRGPEASSTGVAN